LNLSSKWEVRFFLFFSLPFFKDLCSTPKTNYKASVALAQEYKGVTFEAVNGDIIEADADAISNFPYPFLRLTFLYS